MAQHVNGESLNANSINTTPFFGNKGTNSRNTSFTFTSNLITSTHYHMPLTAFIGDSQFRSGPMFVFSYRNGVRSEFPHTYLYITTGHIGNTMGFDVWSAFTKNTYGKDFDPESTTKNVTWTNLYNGNTYTASMHDVVVEDPFSYNGINLGSKAIPSVWPAH